MPASRPLEERFWEKVDKRGGSDCWLWTASQVGDTGYGQFREGKAMRRAHRVAYELHHGVRLGREKILHTCDNPICVNPAHLLQGTSADNSADMVAKRRQSHGEKHPPSKLTTKSVAEIRSTYIKGCPENGVAAQARKHGVARVTIRRTVNFQSWKKA